MRESVCSLYASKYFLLSCSFRTYFSGLPQLKMRFTISLTFDMYFMYGILSHFGRLYPYFFQFLVHLIRSFVKSEVYSKRFGELDKRLHVFWETQAAIASVLTMQNFQVARADARVLPDSFFHRVVINTQFLAEVVDLIGKHHARRKVCVAEKFHHLRFGCAHHFHVGSWRQDGEYLRSFSPVFLIRISYNLALGVHEITRGVLRLEELRTEEENLLRMLLLEPFG